MTTIDFITELFCQVDDVMREEPKHSQANLWPSELVTLGLRFALFLAACGPGDGSITIKTDGMSFVKDEVHVKAGQPVTLHVVNTDGYGHTFDMDEFDIHAPLPAEATFEATFTPNEPGRYRFYCGSPGHEAERVQATGPDPIRVA